MNLRYVQKQSWKIGVSADMQENIDNIVKKINEHSELLARELQFHNYDVASGNIAHGDFLFHPVETVEDKNECDCWEGVEAQDNIVKPIFDLEHFKKSNSKCPYKQVIKFDYCPECGEKLG